eukprot:593057-Prymnesium_polylepis.1
MRNQAEAKQQEREEPPQKTCCVPSVNGELTKGLEPTAKWRPCPAAGRAAVRHNVLFARGARFGHDAEAPRRVAARRS